MKFVFLFAVLLGFLSLSPLASAVQASPAVHSAPSSHDQAFDIYLKTLYLNSHLDAAHLDYQAFKLAATGYYTLKDTGVLSPQRDLLTVVDFTQASTAKRLYVIDLAANKLLFNTFVAHGKNSGDDLAATFSNTPQSQMSSLGFYITDTPYIGEHGLSLRLDGIERGWNDKARDRAIVMHPADYVSQAFIAEHGRLGRSLGCPALPLDMSDAIIRAIAGRTCLFVYYPDVAYLRGSHYLNTSRLFAKN